MSKFFGGAVSASDSSSSEEEEEEESIVSEEEEKGVQVFVPTSSVKKIGASAFLKVDDSDDSDDDKKRVVRSHRDKKWDQMKDALSMLKNSIEVKDWLTLVKTFDSLEKMMSKVQQSRDVGLPTLCSPRARRLSTGARDHCQRGHTKRVLSSDYHGR